MSAVPTDASQQPPAFDEAAFAARKDEVRAYVDGPGAQWAQRVESTPAAALELWDELRERGYLRLAAPAEIGGEWGRVRV